MKNLKNKNRNKKRKIRHLHIRKKINGTNNIPRLNIFKSNKHFYAQIIDDIKRKTIVSSSTLKMFDLISKKNIYAVEKVGFEIAKKAFEKKITKIVFDRSGYLYHGKVKKFAESVRKAGLKF